MIFKSISLYNFRQFKDVTIEFSNDPNQNVTFVTGEITSGKSTLIKAFLWCLYRDNNFEDEQLLSNVTRRSLIPGKEAVVRVEIKLSHDNKDYKISTSLSYFMEKSGNISTRSKPSTKIVIISSSGIAETITDDVAELEINDILKKDLSPYFFFDGETSNIEDLVKKRNLKQAISDIMGLKKFEKLYKITLESEKSGVYQLVSKDLVSQDTVTLNNLKIRLSDILEDKESKESTIKEYEIKLEELYKDKDSINKIIDSNKDVEKDVEERKRLTSKVESLRKSINEDFAFILSSINNNFKILPLLYSNLYESINLGTLLSSSQLVTEKSLTDINSKAIDQIIERGYCICGEQLSNSSNHLKHLIDQKNFIAPMNYGKSVETFTNDYSDDSVIRRNFLNNIDNYNQGLRNNLNDIENAKKAIYEIENRIINKPDLSKYKEKLNELNVQINNLENQKSRTQGNIDMLSVSIERINEDIKRLTKDTSVNKLINQRLAYIKSVNKRAAEYLKAKNQNVLTSLTKYVSETFEAMFQGDRGIKINENFEVITFLKETGEELDESSGLKIVKNFSFVSGLIKCSKEFSIQKDSMDSSYDGKYPLVMDAPFSKLDQENIETVSKQVPNMCDQILIFVLDKDFQISRNAMNEKVGKQYKIHKLSEEESVIKEL
jgi:DNA sulfur modification protein DndD